jgi:hypothetical protein
LALKAEIFRERFERFVTLHVRQIVVLVLDSSMTIRAREQPSHRRQHGKRTRETALSRRKLYRNRRNRVQAIRPRA